MTYLLMIYIENKNFNKHFYVFYVRTLSTKNLMLNFTFHRRSENNTLNKDIY